MKKQRYETILVLYGLYLILVDPLAGDSHRQGVWRPEQSPTRRRTKGAFSQPPLHIHPDIAAKHAVLLMLFFFLASSLSLFYKFYKVTSRYDNCVLYYDDGSARGDNLVFLA